ncbi:MAG: TIGR00270 family protein [Candidatus Diapherotrites archaeon]|nr:TIGR00270 family protein [Candidatus Diapherotrites archaeon]
MECEICGRNVPKLTSITLYGTEMMVCSSCSSAHLQAVAKKHKARKKIRKTNYDEFNLVDFYGLRIRVARENKGLTREELAKRIMEKESLIRRIELEKVIPPDSVIEKLEKFLGINLRRNNEEKTDIKSKNKKKAGRTNPIKTTLADILKLQIGAKK